MRRDRGNDLIDDFASLLIDSPESSGVTRCLSRTSKFQDDMRVWLEQGYELERTVRYGLEDREWLLPEFYEKLERFYRS